jgi:hypothetical protein
MDLETKKTQQIKMISTQKNTREVSIISPLNSDGLGKILTEINWNYSNENEMEEIDASIQE